MYDTRLAQPENAVRPLWDKIVEVIPHWQPHLRDRRRDDRHGPRPAAGTQATHRRPRPRGEPRFRPLGRGLPSQADAVRAEGYNVCVGPFMQTVRDRERLRGWLRLEPARVCRCPSWPWPRTTTARARCIGPAAPPTPSMPQTLGAFLPGVPYLHGGMELAERDPSTPASISRRRSLAACRPMCCRCSSAAAYGWTRQSNLVGPLRDMLALPRPPCRSADRPWTRAAFGSSGPATRGCSRSRAAGWGLRASWCSPTVTCSRHQVVSAPIGQPLTLAPGQVVVRELGA